MRQLFARALLGKARSRAYGRLRDALDFPIVLVAAPAGFGKSTVVREVLRTLPRARRTVQMEHAADLLGVLRALAASVADVAPALSSSFVMVYDRVADAPDAPEQLAAWAAGHLASLEALVVVDGFAGMYDVRAAGFITALIDRTHAHVRWVIIAQSSEHFPVARWLAESRMDVPVDAVDLAFTAGDLLYAAGESADSETIEWLRSLCACSAGWPAVIALALANPAAGDLPAVAVDSEAVYAHFARAVFQALGPESRAFVEGTCLLGTFDASLLECAGFANVDPILAELSAGLGVLSTDGAGSYFYDRLFGRFIFEGLIARGDGAAGEVGARSAAAYELDGNYAAALGIYLMLGDEVKLCSLLTAHGFALIERGEANVVARALQAVPHEILLDFPGALGVKASWESLHGKVDVAEAWFRLALSRITDESQRNEIVYRFGADLVRRERPDAIDVLAPAVSTIHGESPMAAPLLALLAVAHALNGQAAEASVTMDRALRLLPLVDGKTQRARIICQAGYVALHLRDIAAAKTYAAQAYAQAMGAYSYDVAARALSILYNIALDFDDDIAAGRLHLERLADASGRAGSRELLLYATLCRYEIEVTAGNVAEIEALDGDLASLEVFYSVLTTETLLPSQALQASWKGDFYRAYRLLESTAEHQIGLDRRAHRYAEIAVYAAAAGLGAQASAAAESALTLVRDLRSTDKTVLIAQAYIALTFALLRHPGRAAKLLADLACASAASTRVATLVRAVRLLAARYSARCGATDLAAGLEGLEAADLGGVARMIEALPLPMAAPRTRTRSPQTVGATI